MLRLRRTPICFPLARHLPRGMFAPSLILGTRESINACFHFKKHRSSFTKKRCERVALTHTDTNHTRLNDIYGFLCLRTLPVCWCHQFRSYFEKESPPLKFILYVWLLVCFYLSLGPFVSSFLPSSNITSSGELLLLQSMCLYQCLLNHLSFSSLSLCICWFISWCLFLISTLLPPILSRSHYSLIAYLSVIHIRLSRISCCICSTSNS